MKAYNSDLISELLAKGQACPTSSGSGHSGTVFVTQWNAPGWDVGITACSVVTTACIDVTPHTYKF